VQEILLAAGAGSGAKGDKTLLLLQADKPGIDVAKTSRQFSKVAAVNNTTAAKFNGKEFRCIDSTSYFEILAANKTDLVFKAEDDFTIEFWSRNSSVASSWWVYFGSGTQSCLKVYQSVVYLQDQGNYLSFNSNFWPLTAWAHVAIVNKGGVTKLYINGKLAPSTTSFASRGWSTESAFARIGFGEQSVFGSLDQIRISKVARYDGDFAVPTTPFVLD
jgi:hypothetical protein